MYMSTNPKRKKQAGIFLPMPPEMKAELADAAGRAGVSRCKFIREASMMRARIENPAPR
jgi:hypothetical protein